MAQRAGAYHDLALAYFDADGYLLDLVGDDWLLAELAEEGVTPSTVWTPETTGCNAVTDGLRTRRTAASQGQEHNGHPALKNLALYFSPVELVIIQVSNYYDLPNRMGGIAVLTKREHAHPDLLLTAVSLAHSLEMTLHFNQTCAHGYESRHTGVLVVDNRIHPLYKTIFYANHLLYSALNISPKQLNFTPLEEFLPPDHNPELYEMLSRPYVIKGKSMQITPCGGQPVSCVVDSDVYYQPGLAAEGVILYVSTPQLESSQIAHKISNNAILSVQNVIGDCPAIRSAKKRAALLANTDSNIMILGESGVGKDIFAQAIHNISHRKNKPFVAVNCAALPKDLIASELFGYDSGAFTGAKKNGNMGKFELANGGTIFLDEVGDLPLDLQATLLRIVEQKKLMRLGSNRLIDINVKIICATNADLAQMVEQRLFRSDLYFRLSTMKLYLPPLRTRGNDIILLANHFLASISRRIAREDVQVFSPETAQYLLHYPWPGNVRELQNVMECIAQLYPQHTILPEHIAENISLQMASAPPHTISASLPVQSDSHMLERYCIAPAPTPQAVPSAPDMPDAPHKTHGRAARGELTVEQIETALKVCGGNRSSAAKYLGIARKTLYRNMERLGMGTVK